MMRLAFAILAFGAQPSLLTAQVWPALPASRHFEVGFFVQRSHRTIHYDDGASHSPDWARPALFVHVALTPALTLEVNGFAWHAGSDERSPDADYFRYTFGAGLTLIPIRRAPWTGALSLHAHEHGYLDQSTFPFNKRSTQVLVAARISRDLSIASQSAHIWIGPTYIADWIWQYPPFQLPLRGSSQHNLGILAGGSIIAARRVRLFGEVSYLDLWQSQAGVGLVF